ncbi:M23 family metallopeptidase [Streptomyces sp. QL37]|uniref:M23 family metallopeptidase n=1 Tax=Streptomyces sp. QL37 TaxID=2093747 RepID=UPI002916C839|nr:M23 family metallopeptidase [Streptomyces sp. QL37]
MTKDREGTTSPSPVGSTPHDDGLEPRPAAPHPGPAESPPGRPGATGYEPAGSGAAEPGPKRPATDAAHTSPAVDAPDDRRPPRRRRGPGPVTLVVLPSLVILPGVAIFLALTGGLDLAPPQDPGPSQSAVSNVDGSYVPWLRRATADCTGVTPALLAAHIDQLSGWQDNTASLSEQGIARFTEADWKTWGRDDDGNGGSSPRDAGDAIMALGRRDCSLAKKVTALRTKGTVNGDVADLTLAAYATGVDQVKEAGKVPAPARAFVADVKKRLPQYDALVRRNPEQNGPASGALLAPPVTTLTVTSSYGSRTHPLTGVTKLHTGVDFGAPQGAQVSAARDGRVEFAGMTQAYGNRVVIDHGTIDGKRLETTYSHLSALQVTTGQSVTTGHPVGLVGSTGLSTGPHLHFEVLFDGQYMDPLAWLANGG